MYITYRKIFYVVKHKLVYERVQCKNTRSAIKYCIAVRVSANKYCHLHTSMNKMYKYYKFLDGHSQFLRHPDFLSGPDGEFLFVGSDGISLQTESVEKFDGSITMHYPLVMNQKFAQHVRKMTPLNSIDNPWFAKSWREEYNCTFDEADLSKMHCEEFEQLPLQHVALSAWLSPVFDGMRAVTYGLHNVISTNCPESFQFGTILDTCVDGTKLLNSIKNNTFQGTSWTVSFDDAGDIMSPYVYRQLYKNRTENSQTIGTWDQLRDNILIDYSAINWADFAGGADVTRDAHGVPDSVCSYPCGPRQYQQQRELVCCWDCMSCRNNEIINADRDGCEKCPELLWPDDETATYCITIEPRLVYYLEDFDISKSLHATLISII